MKKGEFKDLTGQRFGRLTALERIGTDKNGKGMWRCKCDCGSTVDVSIASLSTGATQSCGCLHRETFTNRTHGESGTRLYRIWHAMKERCYRTGAINFKWYGGKGVKVCEEWKNSFEVFRDWALANGYSSGLTIDRIDSSLGYSPNNCRWLTRAENASAAAKAAQEKRRMALNV